MRRPARVLAAGLLAITAATGVVGAAASLSGAAITDSVNSSPAGRWEHRYVDLVNTVTIDFDLDRKLGSQTRFWVSGEAGPVTDLDTSRMRLYTGPDTSFTELPSNPIECVQSLACLPSTVVECPNASTRSCDARFAVIHYHDGENGISGVFDLETEAFAAVVEVHGYKRWVVSLGEDLDPLVRGAVSDAVDQAAQNGMDLTPVLETEVVLRTQWPDGYQRETRFTLAELFEFRFSVAGPNGIEILPG